MARSHGFGWRTISFACAEGNRAVIGLRRRDAIACRYYMVESCQIVDHYRHIPKIDRQIIFR